MDMRKQIPCKACDGTGRRELNGVYLETLELLRKHPGATGASLARLCDGQPTAINNRLAMLESFGLATSERYGRERRYKVKR